MATIFKYTSLIRNTVKIMMPQGAKVLTAGVQIQLPRDSFAIWAIVEEGAPEEERTFYVRKTGSTITGEEGAYIATFMIDGGQLVFHVFSDRKELK